MYLRFMSMSKLEERAVLAIAREWPEMGRVRAARELARRGFAVTPARVQAVWSRHGLATPLARLKRRAGNGSGVALLSETQRDILRRAKVSERIRRRGADEDSGAHPRRDELIASAAKIFSAKGYERASLREICGAAGILAGSMYRHFRSKEDLFVSVHAEGFRQLNEAVDRALEDRTDPWERFEAVIAAHLTELVGRSDIPVVTVEGLFHRERGRVQRRLDRERGAYEDRFRALIEALPLRAGVDRTLLRLTVLGAINWTRIWYRPGNKTPGQIARHLVRNVLRAPLAEASTGERLSG
jgi:AcrR family transcriptional regulator